MPALSSAQLFPEFIDDHLHTPTAALLAMSCIVPVGSIALALLRDLSITLRVWALSCDPHLIGKIITTGHLTCPMWPMGWVSLAVVALPIGLSYMAQAHTGLYDVRRYLAPCVTDQSRKTVEAAATQYAQCHAGETGPYSGDHRCFRRWGKPFRRMDLVGHAHVGRAHRRILRVPFFAITSVSGGSLAAMTYQIAQSTYLPGAGTSPPGVGKAATPKQQLAFWQKTLPGVVELGRSDLLSSSVSRMFTSDVMFGVPRRGPALEQAFEHYWSLRFDLQILPIWGSFRARVASLSAAFAAARNRCRVRRAAADIHAGVS